MVRQILLPFHSDPRSLRTITSSNLPASLARRKRPCECRMCDAHAASPSIPLPRYSRYLHRIVSIPQGIRLEKDIDICERGRPDRVSATTTHNSDAMAHDESDTEVVDVDAGVWKVRQDVCGAKDALRGSPFSCRMRGNDEAKRRKSAFGSFGRRDPPKDTKRMGKRDKSMCTCF